ncbi:LysR family transcriptional regulator [Aureimonas flava]|uniref:LysR family transcriptional regulator n=1 Tax=Aureimonas flava TaxID=2320271 RepID=A0A3A1WI68_9HYPH|nr:LysR family transcriptional regulator [Aureimonas flava]RIX99729.1 LysR family transcriptional regulator [Aureimonas flava]
MELRQLRHFIAVAETLNFHRAAKRLNMAQPPLSVSIRKLESEIGVRLFDRSSRVTRLTASGHAALAEAREAIRHAAELGRVARAAASGEIGRIRLAFAASATYRLLPNLLLAYGVRFPQVRLELREGTNTQILNMFEAGDIDLALVRVPTTFPSGIELQMIEEDTLWAALPASSPLSLKPMLSMRDFADQQFISLIASGRAAGLNAVTRRVFEEAGISPPITQEALQVHTIVSLVESGLGVAFLPSVCSNQPSARVVFRKIEDMPPAGSTGIALAYRSDVADPAALSFCNVALGREVRQPG